MPSAEPGAWLSLSIDGVADQDLHPYLNSVTFKESKEALDSLEATVSVPESGAGHAIRQKLMVPGAVFTLRFHRGEKWNPPVREVTGDIVAVRHQKTVDGRWTLSLTGLEVLHRLKGASLNAITTDGMDGILAELRDKYNARAEVRDGVTLSNDHLIMLDVDVLSMLKAHADDTNRYLTTDDRGHIVVRGRAASTGKAVVTWGDDVESLSLALDLSGMPTKVTVMGLDELSGKPDDDPVESNDRPLGRQRGGDVGMALRKKLWGDMVSEIHPLEVTSPVFMGASPGDTRNLAKEALQNAADAYLRGSVTVLGCPEASKDATLEIVDAPWPLSGEFIIEDVSHSYTADDGLTSEIEFYSDSVAAKPVGSP